MTRREQQAFNGGKVAFRDAVPIDHCPRRTPGQRAAWRQGWQEEQRRQSASTVAPERIAESSRVLRQLKDWAATNLSTPTAL